MRPEIQTSPERRTRATWRRCGATCPATGAAATNSSTAAPRCTGQHRMTTARRSSPFSWRRARPWTSWTATAARELRRCPGAAGWCLRRPQRSRWDAAALCSSERPHGERPAAAGREGLGGHQDRQRPRASADVTCWEKAGFTGKRTQ